MTASTSILDEKALYGGTLGAHAGHKLNLIHTEYYDSATVELVSYYGIECDMYEGCGAMILDNIKTREEALEIMETIQNAGKAEPTFTRSKGGTAEREEIISQIQVPDLWHLYMALKDGQLTRSKKVQAELADVVYETWQLAHDMRKHLQSNG
jgi:hypothetical protein